MNEIPFSTTADPTDLYRVSDVELFPAGDNLVLVHSKNNQTTQLLRVEVVDLLMQCREFKTLEDHLKMYCHGRQANAVMMRTISRELQKMAQAGYLVSQSSILEMLRELGKQTSTSQIASIGFPTCNRVETLQRSMISYIDNCQRFKRTNDFVVVDDSPSFETRDAYRNMLRTLKSRYGVNISYAGLEEKTVFAKKLIEIGNLPPDVVYFAYISNRQYGISTVGANRNALLLHTVGDLIFSADDDTLCQIAASPKLKKRLKFSSGGNPLDAWFFPDRETAMRSVHFVEQDILELHEQWLGKDTQNSISMYSQDGEVLFDQVEPQSLRRLVTHSGKIVLTLNGTIGDCSWDNSDYHLFQRGDTFRRLTSSEQEYRSARTSREMAQVATQVTIVERADPIFAMCMGLDNRELLPPFMPMGRAEDIAFGTILSKCFNATYAVHLPWVLPHIPPEARAFSVQQMFSVGFNAWISSYINLFDPKFVRTPIERLHKLGQYLEEIGSLSKNSFEEFVRLHIWNSMHGIVVGLEERLQNSTEILPAFWLQDVKAYIKLMQQSALIPVNQLYSLDGGHEVMQRLMVQFGQVLKWWPTLIETAHHLRLEGCRLAQPV